jgi:hypothetical protein
MKKLLVKSKVIDTPYSPAIEAVEATETEPAIEAVPEILEVSHYEIIAQTQGNDEELAQWLAGDSFKYPEGYVVEYIDITAQVEQEAINNEALAYLASTDWMIVREVETQVPCPESVKILRAEARLKIVR